MKKKTDTPSISKDEKLSSPATRIQRVPGEVDPSWMTSDRRFSKGDAHYSYALQKEFPKCPGNSVKDLKAQASLRCDCRGLGEQAYAEGFGSIHDLSLPDDQLN